MDKPADPATPFGEVYQAFLDDLDARGHASQRRSHRYRYNIVRFETLARRDGPAGHPGVARADDPVRLPAAPRDAAAAAARFASGGAGAAS